MRVNKFYPLTYEPVHSINILYSIGYDNWLVAYAINTSATIRAVDLSNTVLAVHLTDFSGNHAGFRGSLRSLYDIYCIAALVAQVTCRLSTPRGIGSNPLRG